jgi:hypothetical protein
VRTVVHCLKVIDKCQNIAMTNRNSFKNSDLVADLLKQSQLMLHSV